MIEYNPERLKIWSLLSNHILKKKDTLTIIVIGRRLLISILSLNFKTSIIIITNKNKIAIAPTYTIISIKAIKSILIVINKEADRMKVNVNQKTEWIGLIDVITIIPEINIEVENNKNNCSINRVYINIFLKGTLQEEVPFLSLCYDLLCFGILS